MLLLDTALKGQTVDGCVLHSDRGNQFRSRKLQHATTRHHTVGAIGRVGAGGDNTAMESFFNLLQKNVLDRRQWTSREDLRIAITTWIKRTHHRHRKHNHLTHLTPPNTKRSQPQQPTKLHTHYHPNLQQTQRTRCDML